MIIALVIHLDMLGSSTHMAVRVTVLTSLHKCILMHSLVWKCIIRIQLFKMCISV